MVAVLRAPAFRSLRRHRNYRLYFAGQSISQIGSWLQNAAQAWLILDLTHSPAQIGVFGFCLYAPYALIGLFGGAIADRADRLRLITVTQTAMALCATALALVAYLHVDRIWIIDAIGVVRGIVLVFNNPARQALIVELVGRSELQNAIALNSSLNNASRVIGPAIAGALIAAFGVATCFGLNAVSFGAVLVALTFMRRSELHREPRHPTTARPLLASIRDGLTYARRTKTVAVVLAMLAVTSTLAINFDIVLPVLARGTLHGGPQTYGFITAAFGLGAFGGAMISASRRRASPRLLLAASAGFGLAQLLVATQTTAIGVAATLLVTGLWYTMYTSSTNALVQLATPGFMQGRVGGLYSYVFLASAPFGELIAGWLAQVGGAYLTLIVGGAAAVAMMLTGLALRPWPMPTGTVPPRRRATRTPHRPEHRAPPTSIVMVSVVPEGGDVEPAPRPPAPAPRSSPSSAIVSITGDG